MHKLLLLISSALMVGIINLHAVDYGGEKSFLMEVPYTVCVVPPEVDEAIAKGVKVTSVANAKKLFDANALFFDARAPRHYKAEHIKGAFPVVFDESKASYIALNLPEDKKAALVFYCYGESCAISYEAALAVRKAGYTNVYWLLNGFPEWKANKFPVESDK
ncbi:rhodanese-like domain-containing protein [Sulfurimonas sp. HSL3-7]|uniref:rhodanese-like domain-containing protein n=1 Tax=Sulfonitrofixus jiaomeiensis TaxID=3131938 RepID=UPI0031F80607